jgi:hypothetical protein
VFDLSATVLDTLSMPISFLPSHALGRGALVHGRSPGDTLGKVYVTFGNVRDLQPFHGWIFEVSLDEWLGQGAANAVRAALVITPDADCGPDGSDGARDHICGGGLWAPSGPLLVPKGDSYEIFLAPDNGRLDLARHEYARTLLRVGPGLVFDDGCDAASCQSFDENAPDRSCAESCTNLFIPRLLPQDPPLRPENGVCDGISNMFECWYKLDYPGGSTPVRITIPEGPTVLVYPNKDGHVFLLDAEHLGTLYDRKELVPVCGTRADPCLFDWGGMIVTQPAVTAIDGAPVVLIPTFMPDHTHAAGVFALRVGLVGGVPQLTPLWQSPAATTAGAHTRFRFHPTRMTLARTFGHEVGWIVDVAGSGQRGTLLGIRSDDGVIEVEQPLTGPGYRFTSPLVHDDVVYVSSCVTDSGPGMLEAFRTVLRPK